MIVLEGQRFVEIIASVLFEMREHSVPVQTERWQGIAANQQTRELQNVVFEIDLQGIEDLDHWRDDIAPNLPWADTMFDERVGGTCLNPGEAWKSWPWGLSAAKFKGSEEYGPRFPPQDWAYLAGMIDGEGTIYCKEKLIPTFQGTLRVYQRDRKVLDYLHNLFRVGKVYELKHQNTVLNGKEYENSGHSWSVESALEVRWLLTGCLPYLRVKKLKAELMLSVIDECLKVKKIVGPSIRKVWGRDWPTRFNHSYQDRLWPKRLEGGSEFVGQHWTFGDLNDFVELLTNQPYTRQAWIPLFFPEDTGVGDGGRKPCTLGYQIIVRNDQAHIWYPLRSCDARRHFQDDCYLAVRLLLWVIDQCRLRNPDAWNNIRPGNYAMHMTSLHVFSKDFEDLVSGGGW